MGTRWGHRSHGAPGGRWWVAALVLPLALAGLVVTLRGGDLEADLRERVQAALADQGVEQAEVSVDGRDVTVSGLVGGTNTGAVRHSVAAVDGVRRVEVRSPEVLGAGTCRDTQRRIDRILGPDKLRFEAGSARLVGAERRQAARVGRLLERCQASVIVRGVASDLQVDAVTDLSQRRAQVVAQVVVKHGGVVDAVLSGAQAESGNETSGDHVVIVVS